MKSQIIWVDDDIALLSKSEEIFNDYGFEVIKCASLAEALKTILSGTCQNLLLDVNFPGNDKEGLIFLEQIKLINPDLTVVLFTGYPELDDAVAMVKRLLASDYIAKPIPVDENRREAFFKKLHDAFDANAAPSQNTTTKGSQRNKLQLIDTALEKGDVPAFIKVLEAIFAGLSYNMKTNEGYFHGFIQIILDVIGMKIVSEVETNIGRIDAVVETRLFIYLMEFKLSDAKTAIEQIRDRKYFQRYLTSAKQIVLVGIAFDQKEKNIKDFAFENY